MKYAWALEGMGKDVDPQAAGEFIEQLEEKFQEHLTPEEILAAARSPRSPIHHLFTWNENDAAEKQRRREARRMMNNLVLAPRGRKSNRRAFVLVKHSKHDKQVYLNLRSAMGRPDLRDQVLQRALKPLQRWIGTYGNRSDMRFLSKNVERLRDRIQAEILAVTT